MMRTTSTSRPRSKQCIDPGIHAIDATHRSIGHRFKARVEEVQQIDVVEAVFGDEGPPLDLEKMAALGKEAAVVGVAAIAGAFLLLFSSLFFTQSKSPLKEQPVENTDPGVCLSGKCANGAPRVRALEFTSDRFADDRNEARAANPEPFLE